MQARSMFPARLAVVLVLAAGLALVYVCMKSRTDALGREIKQLEVKREQLRARLVKEQCEWAKLQAPGSLEKALKEHGLVMTWPGRDQIVRLRADGTIDPMTGPEPRTSGRYPRVDRIVMND